MKKLLAVVFLSCVSLFAQTHIVDTLHDPTDAPGAQSTVKGTISIVSQAFTFNGVPIPKTIREIKISAGVVDLYLAPNDANTSYTANYSITGSSGVVTSYKEKWVVQTSVTSLTLQQVKVDDLVVSATVVGVPIPPLSGTFCLQSVNKSLSWVSGSCGGSSGGLLFDSISGLFDSGSGQFDTSTN